MKTQFTEIPVRQIVEGYADNDETGPVGYDGKLDIRPPYQREFVYGPEKRDAVINTVRNDFPLMAMYLGVKDDGRYEMVDGQQRTISICQYVTGQFSVDGMYFSDLQPDEQEQILNYTCSVYLCSGTDKEYRELFVTANRSYA